MITCSTSLASLLYQLCRVWMVVKVGASLALITCKRGETNHSHEHTTHAHSRDVWQMCCFGVCSIAMRMLLIASSIHDWRWCRGYTTVALMICDALLLWAFARMAIVLSISCVIRPTLFVVMDDGPNWYSALIYVYHLISRQCNTLLTLCVCLLGVACANAWFRRRHDQRRVETAIPHRWRFVCIWRRMHQGYVWPRVIHVHFNPSSRRDQCQGDPYRQTSVDRQVLSNTWVDFPS